MASPTIDWLTKVITIPQSFLAPLGGSSYQLDTNALRIELKTLEESEAGIPFPPTHSHNTSVSLGGIQYARVIEILAPYTITFEEKPAPYVVSLVGSNNNILERTNLGTVQILANNSAGLINVVEVQQSSFEGNVTIDVTNGTAGSTYPIGTLVKPTKTLADAKAIALARGIDSFYILGNLTIGASDNVAALRFEGDGATLNLARTTVTLTQGCVTSNTHWRNAKITGYQGGESFYDDCIIDGLDNAHCFYTRCGLIDGTARGYTIRQTTSSSGHASYFKECFSDEGTFILDRNSSKLNVTFDGFSGRILIKNQARPNNGASDMSGSVFIHMNGGTVTIDSTCTQGSVVVSGVCQVINNGTCTVDVSRVSASWNDPAASFNVAGTMGNKVNTTASGGVDIGALVSAIWADAKALTVGKFLGLK